MLQITILQNDYLTFSKFEKIGIQFPQENVLAICLNEQILNDHFVQSIYYLFYSFDQNLRFNVSIMWFL